VNKTRLWLGKKQKTDWRTHWGVKDSHWGKEFQRKINPLERHKLTPGEKQKEVPLGKHKNNEVLPV
jgi:hypothetical protein